MSIRTVMRDGVEVRIARTHAPWIHPTKGYRELARPRKTNRRRRPIGAVTIPHSTEANKVDQKRNGGRLRKLTAPILRKLRAIRSGVWQPGKNIKPQAR
jgi:hypothetical protein